MTFNSGKNARQQRVSPSGRPLGILTSIQHIIIFRTVFFNVFQNVIVVLYVFDNDTNPMIKISCFVGLAIECWKVLMESCSLSQLS